MLTSGTPNSLMSAGRGAVLTAPALRCLALLLLLTPLLGAVRVLIGREAPVRIVTEVVEVPQTVYVQVPGPTVIVQVPAEPPPQDGAPAPDVPTAQPSGSE